MPSRFCPGLASFTQRGKSDETLITAASGGIGSGIAAALADAGVHVAISGRTSAALEQVAGRLASSGGRPAIVVGTFVRRRARSDRS